MTPSAAGGGPQFKLVASRPLSTALSPSVLRGRVMAIPTGRRPEVARSSGQNTEHPAEIGPDLESGTRDVAQLRVSGSSGKGRQLDSFGKRQRTSPRVAPSAHPEGLKPARRQRAAKSAGGEIPPPTPWGCEWRPTADGWSLWRCWSEKDVDSGGRVRKSRYAGSLSREAWEVMKGYDYETILATIGQQFRRHGKR